MVAGSGMSGRSVDAVIAYSPFRRPGQAKREPGPITTYVYVVRSWSRNPINNQHRWLWVPAFAGTTTTPSYPFAAAFGQYLSRRCRFTSLPVGVRGSSASKSILLGHLIGDRCFLQNSI